MEARMCWFFGSLRNVVKGGLGEAAYIGVGHGLACRDRCGVGEVEEVVGGGGRSNAFLLYG